jgi:hypothetical protein
MMQIDAFLAALETALCDEAGRERELIEELRGHLEDAARDLQLAGWNVDASEAEAVRQCGRPEEIIAALRASRGSIMRALHHSRAILAGAVLTTALLCFSGGMVAAAHISHPGVERTTNEQTIDRGSCHYSGSHSLVIPGPACSGRTTPGTGREHATNPAQR